MTSLCYRLLVHSVGTVSIEWYLDKKYPNPNDFGLFNYDIKRMMYKMRIRVLESRHECSSHEKINYSNP